ncbi:hypothetical protein J1G36_25515 [Pseudomonas carnis]|uniref:hypothetical protein n=1 Tax=Pseudomonas TaxID=286 RepID=UPI000F584EBD|nr:MULTISPECIES: hypothetical protein [Pseudomonas]AZC90075.1 hypothetical protein C4K29_3776 [Pseudomonas chlororaphis subsp. piscium]MBY8955250.1 hypothetical protein [Pseudomonas carnis]
MSAILLAERLDQLNADGAFIRESENDVSASGLAIDAAISVIALCRALAWNFDLFDRAGTEWQDEDLLQDFAPYRLLIRKPRVDGDALVLLTNTGFAEWLKVGHAATQWQVARLRQRIATHARLFQPWGEADTYQPSDSTKSPRALVREFGAERYVPEDIRPWLIRSASGTSIEDAAADIWRCASVFSLLNALADEIDPVDRRLKFKGPPKLSISLPVESDALIEAVSLEHFNDLQRAASWVFENEREAELRHGLLANDIARSAGGNGDDLQVLLDSISDSLEGAKVAYQVSLSDLGRDTLKMLADLRKAVTEETAKVTDATRQLVTSVSGALAIGLGLIAARVSAAAGYELIVAVMVVVSAYVGVVIYSGYGFIQLQRQLRSDWQPRLYRFLPPAEYDSMVDRPAAQAERTFFKVAWGGGVGVFALMVIVVFGWWGEAKRSVIIAPSSPEPTHLVPQAANAADSLVAGGLGKTSEVDSSAAAAETVETTSKPKEVPILEADEK